MTAKAATLRMWSLANSTWAIITQCLRSLIMNPESVGLFVEQNLLWRCIISMGTLSAKKQQRVECML
jgi:hypothetical protein